jgi:hypothetical protein
MLRLAGTSGLAKIAEPLTLGLLTSLGERARGGERPAFAIPTNLRHAYPDAPAPEPPVGR